MELTSPRAFWLIRNGIGEVPPPITADGTCDVAIIGAGVTGAFVADALTARGLSVIAVDCRHPGHGSTSASTALLQYEIDTHLTDLIELIGYQRAVDAYQASLDGLRMIERLANEFETDIGFRRRPSVYLASRARDVEPLRREAAARRRIGLPSEVLGPQAIQEIVGGDVPLALWSDVAGEVDPWRLTKALLARCATRRFQLRGRTEVVKLVPTHATVDVHTDRGLIRAEQVVVAAGYEADRFLPKPVASLHSTFAIVTEPVTEFGAWKERCLIWSSARPYPYLRTTIDNRIIIGGEDTRFKNAVHRDARIASKSDALIAHARQLFPDLAMEVAYSWAGTFGESDDGLPFIGAHPDGDRRIHFALAYGGNGITFGAVAADIIASVILAEPHRYRDSFAFHR